MKKMLEKLMECLLALLPFFRNKGTAKKMKEFCELVTEQYAFLMSQLEKALQDYFELSARVKEMHAEILSLKDQLGKALNERCQLKECAQRQ